MGEITMIKTIECMRDYQQFLSKKTTTDELKGKGVVFDLAPIQVEGGIKAATVKDLYITSSNNYKI
jgi:hypothetical protein